jgi:hypothetical protein
MDTHLIPAGDPEHRFAQLHLPWYATGQLDAAEQARVARHVAGCAACQADLALDAALAAHPAEPPALSVEGGWQRFTARLDAGDAPAPRSAARARSRTTARGLFADWRGYALAAQFVLIMLLGVWLAVSHPAPASYRSLGRPMPRSEGDLLVMFAPETREGALRALLTQAGARVVDGPTVTGAYVLDLPQGGQQAALSTLRSSPQITLAEPLGPEPQR